MLIGSQYFFKGIEGFTPHDKDILFIVEPRGFKFIRQSGVIGRVCIFEVNANLSKEELFNYTLTSDGPAMKVGKFLVPEFNAHFGITIEDLPRLAPLIERLDEPHSYERVIYEAYLSNGGFFLDDAQRQQAYDMYRETRKDDSRAARDLFGKNSHSHD